MKRASTLPARILAAGVAAVAMLPPPVFADAPGKVSPERWRTAWSFEPGVIVTLFVAAACYATGLRWLRRATHAPGKLRREAFCFWMGWLVLAIALVSPVDPLGQVLFSAHMVQHELLMVAAAPLLVLGRPGLVWLWALPRSQAQRLGNGVRRVFGGRPGHALLHPATACLVQALALWIWHVPRFFQSALGHEGLHVLQHACFFGSALWFWHSVFQGPARRAGYGMGVVYLFTTALHRGALGALITLAAAPWYPRYAATAGAWGLTALEDQQLGGLVMWVPAGLTYVVAALALFAGWLRPSERSHGAPLASATP